MKKQIDNVTIVSNNHNYPVIYGYELTPKQAKRFDYMTPEELENMQFVLYRNWLYAFSDFMNLHNKIYEPNPPKCFNGYDGCLSDSLFSGVLIRFLDDSDFVQMATYYS